MKIIRAAFLPDNDSPKSKKKKKNTETEEEEKAGNVVQYRDKDAVLSGLEQTLPYLRGKRSRGCINENSRSSANEEGRKHGRRGNSTLLSTFAMLQMQPFIADRAKRKAEGAEKPDNI